MKYKNNYSDIDSKDFWEEVLVGRKIESINYDDRLHSLTLDNGETVYVSKPEAISVIVETENEET